ncbi:hypothetical protein ACC686_35890, partial [Rhizobium johnstonii]
MRFPSRAVAEFQSGLHRVENIGALIRDVDVSRGVRLAAISGSGTDLGLLFSTTAGLAAGCLATNASPRRATRSL